jgi:hypothetical protein
LYQLQELAGKKIYAIIAPKFESLQRDNNINCYDYGNIHDIFLAAVITLIETNLKEKNN